MTRPGSPGTAADGYRTAQSSIPAPREQSDPHEPGRRSTPPVTTRTRGDEAMSTTSDRNDPRLTHGADEQPVPMAEAYLVLSDAERAAGFVRPVRRSYVHTRGCGAVTTMGQAIAETYARNPSFYGATYCVGCSMHRPVGPDGEFDWDPKGGEVIPADRLAVGS